LLLLSQEQQGKDEVTINEPDLEKPEKPKPATVDDARQRIIEKYNNIRRLPGLCRIPFENTAFLLLSHLIEY